MTTTAAVAGWVLTTEDEEALREQAREGGLTGAEVSNRVAKENARRADVRQVQNLETFRQSDEVKTRAARIDELVRQGAHPDFASKQAAAEAESARRQEGEKRTVEEREQKAMEASRGAYLKAGGSEEEFKKLWPVIRAQFLQATAEKAATDTGEQVRQQLNDVF